MFTTWDQVRSWIEDNGFQRWQFYKTKPEERAEKNNDLVIDSNNFTVSDLNDKLEMTEKYLRMYGNKVYGMGFTSPNYTTSGGVQCEVRLTAETEPTQAGVGTTFGMGELQAMEANIEKRLRATIESEMRERDYQKRLADLEKREKAYDEEKQTALGAIVHYFAPVGQMLMKQKMGLGDRLVAGVDAEEPVHAQRIVAHDPDEHEEPHDEPETQEPENEPSPFTDEEADKLFDLLARFKAVEPDYMQLLEAVVTMAENGDGTYKMAKGFLVK